MNVVLFGPPGSGKGTQAEFLVQHFGIPQVATGDLFRAETRAGTELGKTAKEFMDKGDLVPDDLTIEMFRRRLQQPDAEGGVLLDGFPRTVDQAKDLDHLLADLGSRMDAVIYVRVPLDLLVSRLSGRLTCPVCGHTYHMILNPPRNDTLCDRDGAGLLEREDDSAGTARKRIGVYMEQTLPVLDHYRRQGCVSNIDGEGTIDEVRGRVLAAVRGVQITS